MCFLTPHAGAVNSNIARQKEDYFEIKMDKAAHSYTTTLPLKAIRAHQFFARR